MVTRILNRALCMSLCALLLMGASGCASNKNETTEAPIVLPSPTPELKATGGGELYMPMPANAQINEPYTVTTEEMLSFYTLIYEPLITLDATGKITACLAEHWEGDEQGLVWTFHLRNAKWHDNGSRLNANDVVFSYEKIISYASASYYAYNVSNILSMQAIDDETVQITMKQPGIAALYALNFPIIRSDYDLIPGARPIGTGPYKVDQIGSTSITLIKNENWWKQTPYIEKIVCAERDSNDTALASYAADQLNFVPTSNVTVGTYRSQNQTQVLDVMTQGAELLVINGSNTDLRNTKVRQAIAYAIDRSSIITNAYMNRAQAADVPVAPDSWLYEPKSKVYDYDIEKAKTLLSESGWTDINGDGVLDKEGTFDSTFSLRLLVCQGTDNVRKTAADMITSQLSQVGIVVNVETAAYSLADPNNEFMNRLNAGDYDIALLGMNFARNADLRALISTNGTANYGHFSDVALEKLCQNIMTATDEVAYKSAASQFQLQFVDELPCIILYFRLNSIVCTSLLQGMNDTREPDLFRNIEKWYMYTE